MIEIRFEDKKRKCNRIERWRRRKRQKKGKWKLYYTEQNENEITILELPVCYEEGKELGKEWFLACLQKIKQEYPKEMIYIFPNVCRTYELPDYKKNWIAGYFFFSPFWSLVKKMYDIKEAQAEIVVCDTLDVRSILLVERLALRGKRIEVITTEPKRWKKVCEKFYDEHGLVIEVTEEEQESFENKILFDFDGNYLKRYKEWEKENLILCPCLKEEQKAYLRNRVNKKHIVCGYVITMEENPVDKTFAAIYMQSKNWRVRQMANTGEIRFEENEITSILHKHKWDVGGIEQI